MDNNSKKKLILQLVEIAENLVPTSINKDTKTKIILFKDKSFLIKNYPEVYNQLRGKILSGIKKDIHFSNDAFTKNYVFNFIDELLLKILEKGTDYVRTNPLSVDIFDRFFHEVTVFLPVDGVKLSVPSLKIGKIVIKHMSEEEIKRFSSLPRNLAFKDWINNPWAEFTTFAEDKKAMEQALNEIEVLFDLIRFSIPFIYSKGFKVSVGLQGDIPNLARRIYVTKPDLSKIFVNENYPSGGAPFDISDKNIDIMKNIGVFKIKDILEKLEKKRTDFEHTILLGVHWFADSQTQKELENEFLSLMICLEIFLTPNNKQDPISTSISEAAAIILKPEEERMFLKGEIQSYYTKRSDIVHGRKSILTEEDVDKLREHLKHLIPFMVNHKDDFEEKKDLMNLINEYKLQGDIFKA